SPIYGEQMKEQLISLGYEENVHFFLIREPQQNEDEDKTAYNYCLRETKRGKAIYERLKKKYGGDTHFFIMRGATGDIFLNGLYLKAYAKKRGIENYVAVGDGKGLTKILKLFDINKAEKLEWRDAEAFQQCYKFFRLPDVTDLFLWQGSLYLNRCRTRMRREFNFLDTYDYYVYKGMVSKDEWTYPNFIELNDNLRQKYETMGVVEGKTVIIAPYAYSVKNLPEFLWEEIAGRLREKGYGVFVNINESAEVNLFDNIPSIMFPFAEAKALITYAGNFLSLRSGLCDIVSLIPCNQVVLYPEEMKPIDYGIHRSDANFSSLRVMSKEAEKYITEISSPVIRDIADKKDKHFPYGIMRQHYVELIGKVESVFDGWNKP
ncbi:MAG: hypothetical protein IKN43_05820, partial [Selenomonadaceae bacterium]|nr:hypothetical protein [Selenomonadaceae bacterium]